MIITGYCRQFLKRWWPVTVLCFAASVQAAHSPFTDSLMGLCLASYSDKAKVETFLKNNAKPITHPDELEVFLPKRDGRAWFFANNGEFYALALRTDASCYLYAQKINKQQLRQEIASVLSKPAAGIHAREEVDYAKREQAKLGASKIQAYSWQLPGLTERLLFTVITADDPKASVQALASTQWLTPE